MTSPATAIVIGVGPGLGLALVRLFAKSGMQVAMAARSGDRLDTLRPGEYGDLVRAYSCDSTDPGSVEALFAKAASELGDPGLVVYNAGAYKPGGILEITAEDFERCWKVGCLGGFLVGQAAARRMVTHGQGTIIFTGATAALRGGKDFANLAVPKFGLRALAQSMARELGPQGIHVAHVVIDGVIDIPRTRQFFKDRPDDFFLKPDHIADTVFHLAQQERSAWTFELDVRPFGEKW